MQRVRSAVPGWHRVWIATCAIASVTIAPAALGQAAKKATPAPAAAAGTLDRIRMAGTLKLGYRDGARPFAYKDEAGQAAGYSVELCKAVAEAVKSELNLPALKVEWVPVGAENRFQAVQQGQIDVLCGAETVTLERRKLVSFSTPIFPGGVGVLVRSDAPLNLREVLSGRSPNRPNWRASVVQVLHQQTFGVVAGTTGEEWLNRRRTELKVDSKVAPVADYAAGVQAVLDRKANAFFAERAVLLDAAKRGQNVMVIDRLFTYEPIALAMARGDDDFRLLVDRTLSQFYGAAGFRAMYTTWFGEPDEAALTFFRWNTLMN